MHYIHISKYYKKKYYNRWTFCC